MACCLMAIWYGLLFLVFIEPGHGSVLYLDSSLTRKAALCGCMHPHEHLGAQLTHVTCKAQGSRLHPGLSPTWHVGCHAKRCNRKAVRIAASLLGMQML